MPPNITMLQVGVTCLDCGGGFALVNPGGTCGSETKTVLACVDCGEEWLVTCLMRRLGKRGPCPERVGGRVNRPRHEVEALVAEAHRLVEAGATVRWACEQVGVDRHSYYHRHPARVG